MFCTGSDQNDQSTTTSITIKYGCSHGNTKYEIKSGIDKSIVKYIHDLNMKTKKQTFFKIFYRLNIQPSGKTSATIKERFTDLQRQK